MAMEAKDIDIITAPGSINEHVHADGCTMEASSMATKLLSAGLLLSCSFALAGQAGFLDLPWSWTNFQCAILTSSDADMTYLQDWSRS